MISKKLNIDLPEDKEEDKVWKYPKDGNWVQPTGRFDWVKPVALQWGEWDEWRTDMKRRYPIRYFIHESISDIWSDFWEYGIRRYFHDRKWELLHRFHPKHRYNIIKTGLKPGYYDPMTLIFEGTFQLLVKFVEDNIHYDRIDWEGDDLHSAAWKEMKELVHWYKEIYPNREELFDKERPEPSPGMNRLFHEKHRDDPDVVKYKEYLDRYNKQEAEWAKEDEANLIRVIKVREFLWYA